MEKGNNEENEALVGKDVTLQISQLQTLVVELKAGFTGAMQELSRIQRGDQFVQEQLRACGTEWQEQLKELKDTFRTLKEELQGTHNQMREMSERQREMKECIEMLQRESQRHQTKPLAQNSKMWNGEDEKLEDRTSGHKAYDHKTYENYEPAINQHYLSSPSHNSFQKAAHRPDMEEGVYSSPDVQQRNELASPMLTDHQDFQEQVDTETMTEYSDHLKDLIQSRYETRENESETNHLINQLDSKKVQLQKEKYQVKRQQAALELLESERRYMFYLSLILKTSVTVKGRDIIFNSKDLRNIFPSSLGDLTQQHVCVLHTLEERIFRWHWRGIVGDVFMKLINGDDDKFLENYIIYLKELPECVSILNICCGDSLKLPRQHEDDCDEARPDLLSLLFQPVERIPEYVELLQNILKYTEQNHPDYYLLLLCIQQFQIFMSRCCHLFQCNEELRTQNRRDLKRFTVPQSRLKGSEQNQSMKSDEWEFTHQRHEQFDNPDYRPFYTTDLDLGPKSLTMKSALEVDSETCCRETRGYFNLNKARFIVGPSHPTCSPETYVKNFPADYKTFLNREGEMGLEEQETCLNPDEEESIQNASLLDQCSFASSDSSLDVRFMKRLNYIPARDLESAGCSLELTPKHSPVEEDTDAIHKHICYEAGHSVFNEAQSENYARNITENLKSPITSPLGNIEHPALKTEGASPSHIKASINKRPQKTITSSSRSEVDSKQPADVWMELEKFQENSGIATSGQMEDMCKLYKKEENKQTAYSDSRKQEQKGGFRNSFRKLFRKKSNQSSSSSETKQKSNENPTEETTTTADQEFLPRSSHVDQTDRGTAV